MSRAILKLKRPLPRIEPGIPEMPSHLSDAAKRQWFELSHILMAQDLLTPADGIELGLLAETMAAFVDVCQRMNAGTGDANKLRREKNRLSPQLFRGTRHFGMTPLSRAYITRYGR